MKKLLFILLSLPFIGKSQYIVPRGFFYYDTRQIEYKAPGGVILVDSFLMMRQAFDTSAKPLYPTIRFFQTNGTDSSFWQWDMVRWKPLGSSFVTNITSDLAFTWSVLDSLNTPPAFPATGSKYEVGTSPTGAFVGHATEIATWSGSAWTFETPIAGNTLLNITTDFVSLYTASNIWLRQGKPTVHVGGDAYTAPIIIGSNDAQNVSIVTSGTSRISVIPTGDITFNNAYTFPTTDGTSGQVLQTDGSGNVDWATVSGGAGGSVSVVSATDANGFDFTVTNATTTPNITLTTTVADTRVMYSSSGAVTGSPSMVYNGSGALTLGFPTSQLGQLNLAGNTSGTVTVKPAAAAGTYNFNLPITAGTTGYVLTSGGGGSNSMTWNAISSLGALSHTYDNWTIAGDTIFQTFNVEHYGAVAGKWDSTGAGSTGANHTVTITTSRFTANDVGSYLVLYGAGTSGRNLYTTITGFTDANTVTIAGTIASSVSTKTVVWGIDNTTMFQNAINAAFAAHGGTVVIPDGIWIIAGQLQHAYSLGYTTIDPNSQLVIPYSSANSYYSTGKCHIILQGQTPPVFTQSNNSAQTAGFFSWGGTILYSFLTSFVSSGGLRPSMVATDGDSVLSTYNFSYTYLNIENLAFLTPGNPAGGGAVVGAVNYSMGSSLDAVNCLAYTDVTSHNTVWPNNDVCGFEWPNFNSETENYANQVSAFRYRTNFSFGEHVNVSQIFSATAKWDVEFKKNLAYPCNIGKIISQRSKNIFHVVGQSWNVVNVVAAEVDTTTANLAWATWQYAIVDTANLWAGTVYDYMIKNISTGSISTPGVAQYDWYVNGATNVNYHPIDEIYPYLTKANTWTSTGSNTFNGDVELNFSTSNYNINITPSDSSFQIANTKFVKQAIISAVSGAYTASNGITLTGLNFTNDYNTGLNQYSQTLKAQNAWTGGALFLQADGSGTGSVKMGADSGFVYDISNHLETITKDGTTDWQALLLKNVRTSTSTVFDTTDVELDATGWKTTSVAGSENLKFRIRFNGASGTTHPGTKVGFGIDNAGATGDFFTSTTSNGGNPSTGSVNTFFGSLFCGNVSMSNNALNTNTIVPFSGNNINFGSAYFGMEYIQSGIVSQENLSGLALQRGGTYPAATLFQLNRNQSAGWGTVSITNLATSFSQANLAGEFLKPDDAMVINGNTYTVTTISGSTVNFTPAFSSATASYSITSVNGGAVVPNVSISDNGIIRFGGTSHTSNTAGFINNTSIAMPYVAKTGTYTAGFNDYTIDCTSGTFTVTLPDATVCTGRIYNITNSGAGTITVGTTSSQTFNNVSGTPTTLTLSAVGNYQIQSTGAGWLVL